MGHTDHHYLPDSGAAEIRTTIVMALTGAMMAAEIVAGTVFNSMALLADGWHMGTHMAAFLIALTAYWMARRHRNNPRFSFGTGKIGVLGAFSSSILLLLVAGAMIVESADRLLRPHPIRFGDALLVAAIGLAVNLVSALLLRDSSHHGHSHGNSHGHGHAHGPAGGHDHDKNLKAAYLHVVADAFTSVTAIAALVVGFFFGILWIDAVMGFLGSAVIVWWAVGMIKDAALVLVDYFPKQSDLEDEIRRALAALPDTAIDDLHLWQLAPGKFAAIVSVAAARPQPESTYRALIDVHEELVHLTIQVAPLPRTPGA